MRKMHGWKTNLDDDSSSTVSSVSTCVNSKLSGAEKLSKIAQKSKNFKEFLDRLERCITVERKENIDFGLCSHQPLSAVCKEIAVNELVGSSDAVAEAMSAFNDTLRELYTANGGEDDDGYSMVGDYIVVEPIPSLSRYPEPSRPVLVYRPCVRTSDAKKEQSSPTRRNGV